MLSAVLLDLDNTMVIFDEPAFYRRYFERLSPRFADIWPSPEFARRVITAIGSLGRNKGRMSNLEFFLSQMTRDLDGAKDEIWERFLDFYQTEYDQIEKRATGPEGLHETLAALESFGLPLVVATNPVFPMLAQEKRLSWVGLSPGQFERVTHIENTSFVKPQAEYYNEVCRTIGHRPEDCLMVGNDRVNDMAAANTGMRTYLTTEVGRIDYGSLSLTDPAHEAKTIPEPNFTGPFADLPKTVARLMEAG